MVETIKVETIRVNPNTLSRELELPQEKVEATLELLESGLSAPFIMRYRQDQTGLNSAQDVARIAAAYEKQRKFADRKFSYLLNIEKQGALTPELYNLILETRAPHRLEDLYMPFRARVQGPAQTAREQGLEPLADAILAATDAERSVEELAENYAAQENLQLTSDAALEGAIEIIAERYSENFELRKNLRGFILRAGSFVVSPIDQETPAQDEQDNATEPSDATNATPQDDAESKSATNDAERLKKKSHSKAIDRYEPEIQRFEPRSAVRGLALDLDALEATKTVEIKLEFDRDEAFAIARQTLEFDKSPYAAILEKSAEKAVFELVAPALEQETRREMRDEDTDAELDDLQRALANKLTQRPIVGRRVLAIDFGRRSSGKAAALDQFGNPLAVESIHLRGGAEERRKQDENKLAELVERFGLSVVAVRATGRHAAAEPFIQKFIENHPAAKDLVYILVSDVGLDAYADSEDAKNEEPYYDAAERRAISLGRRALTPLEEFAKVEPELLCEEGTLRRRLRTKQLRDAIVKTLSSCVSSIGLDLNRATRATLRYVSGLTPMAADNIVAYRKANGRFQTREELKNVGGISDSTFAACSGFLKITNGANPLDATWIHPEDYAIATRLLEKIGATCEDLRNEEQRAIVATKFNEFDLDELAKEFEVGSKRLAFIVSELCEPGIDARELLPPPIFKKKPLPLDAFKPGMELLGNVVYVSPFGAFVDVGATIAGLAHVSQISNRPIRDARTVVATGDLVKVRVLDVDLTRERISLAFVNPVAGGAREERRPRRRDEKRTPREEGARDEESRRRPRREQPNAAAESERARRPRRENAGHDAEERERRPRRRDRDEDRQPRNAHVPPKDKVVTTLSEEKKSGKESLQSFEELMLFLQQDQNGKSEG